MDIEASPLGDIVRRTNSHKALLVLISHDASNVDRFRRYVDSIVPIGLEWSVEGVSDAIKHLPASSPLLTFFWLPFGTAWSDYEKIHIENVLTPTVRYLLPNVFIIQHPRRPRIFDRIEAISLSLIEDTDLHRALDVRVLRNDEIQETLERAMVKCDVSNADLASLRRSEKDEMMNLDFFLSGQRIQSARVLTVYSSQAKPKLLQLSDQSNVIFKEGDNLHVDQVVLSMFEILNMIWREHDVRMEWRRSMDTTLSHVVFVQTYRVVPINGVSSTGFIEFLPGRNFEGIWDRNLFFRDAQHKYNPVASSLRPDGRSFVGLLASAVGTFVACFIFGIGDRHQGNIMLTEQGHIVNIDFGFSFGESTFLVDAPHFPIPWSVINFIQNEGFWERFKSKCWESLCAIRPYLHFLDNLLVNFNFSPSVASKIHRTLHLARSCEQNKLFDMIEKGKWMKLPKDFVHFMGV